MRHLALRELLDQPEDDPRSAARAPRAADPIAAILAAQHPDGYWEKPGPGYATKYRGTVWSLMFLDQLGADPAEPRVQRACAYVLDHSQARPAASAARRPERAPPPPARSSTASTATSSAR